MHLLDWAIIGSVLFFLAWLSWRTTKVSSSVADFLSANRRAGRYMLATCTDMGTFAAITMIAVFEMYYHAGFPGIWWGLLTWPVSMLLAITGWIQYRYRETRALTMPQFFEVRYGKKFRVFSGFLAFLAGILNYGIFPAVTARFFIYFCDLPHSVDVFGLSFPTFQLVMLLLLSVALGILLCGGQVTVMVTDFVQGQLLFITFILVFFFVVSRFGFSNIFDALQNAEPGYSKVNPFDQSEVKDFNLWFFLIITFNRVYGYMAWPSSQGYFAAARTPHEAKMSRIISGWSEQVKMVLMVTLPICVWVIFNSAEFSNEAASINGVLGNIDDEHIQSQMRVPVALREILPIGLVGLFASIMIGAAVSTDNTFVHSWGSIFIQDVIGPFLKKPLTPKQHISWLRRSVIGVAAFAFVFSSFFPLQEYIFMYWQITSAIYLSGAGIVIIGGLYTRFGTYQGAWAAMITGSSIALTGIVLRVVWSHVPFLAELGPEYPINGVWMLFIAVVASSMMYLGVSAFTCKERFDLDKLLHRGKYAIADDHFVELKKPKTFLERLGLTSEFTKGDRALFFFKIGWSLFFFFSFIAGTTAAVLFKISDEAWVLWWKAFVVLMFGVGAIAVIWFLVGGTKDLLRLFHDLKYEVADEQDDGRVESEPKKNKPKRKDEDLVLR